MPRGFLFRVCQRSLLCDPPVVNLSQARDNALAHDRKPQPAVNKVQRRYGDSSGYAGPGQCPLSKAVRGLRSPSSRLGLVLPRLQAGKGEQV